MVDSLKQTGKLPSNFIIKAEAIQLGWKSLILTLDQYISGIEAQTDW